MYLNEPSFSQNNVNFRGWLEFEKSKKDIKLYSQSVIQKIKYTQYQIY